MWGGRAPAVSVSPTLPALLAVFAALSSPTVLAAVLLAAISHEAGHYAALRRCGGRVRRLRLTALGAEMDVGDTARLSYRQEMGIVLAGPAANLLLGLILGTLGQRWETAWLLAGAHLVLGLFNLLPAAPLDGGRLMWLLLALLTEPFTADRGAAAVGLAVSGVLAAGGIALTCRAGGSPFLLVGALGLLWRNLREKGLVKSHAAG